MQCSVTSSHGNRFARGCFGSRSHVWTTGVYKTKRGTSRIEREARLVSRFFAILRAKTFPELPFLVKSDFWYFYHRERILRLEHENKKLKEQKLGEQEEQVRDFKIVLR